MKPKLTALVVACMTWASVVLADETPKAALLVLNKGDTSLAIVDPVSLKVVARLPAGMDPHEVEATSDGKLAFISNYSNGRTLTVIDLVAQKVLPPVDLGGLRAPHGLAVRDGKIYFTTETSKAIGRYDPATEKVDWILGVGQERTHMIAVSKDARMIFTANVNSNTITILDSMQPPGRGGRAGGGGAAAPAATWRATHIAVGRGPEGFDVSPDEKELWAANSADGTISIIDVATKAVVATLSIPTRSANRLKFSPDGKLALISDLGGGELVVVDVGTRKEVKRLKLASGAAGILMNPDGSKAYVSVGSANGVEIVDLKTLELVGHIASGPGPDGLAWAVRN